MTLQEHFIAHKILAEDNPSNQGVCIAYWRMCNRGGICTKEEYEIARQLAAEKISLCLRGREISEEHKQHLRDTIKNKLNGYRGASNPAFGYRWTEEQKQHHSEIFSDGRRAGSNNPMYGKPYTEERRNKQRLTIANHGGRSGKLNGNFGHGEKVSSGLNGRAKKCLCIDTGEIFDCLKDAGLATNQRLKYISLCCKGSRETDIYGNHWKFMQEDY